MPVLHARSSAEAHLFMALHPCAACGDEQFDATVRSTLVGEDLQTAYAGPCRTCRAGREFRFRIDDESVDDGQTLPLSPGEPRFGRAAPSTIIDAGQWLRCADRILEVTPTTVLGVSEEEWVARRFLFAAAAESVGEVLKFIPAGADDVPERHCWTEEGQDLRKRSPDRFARGALERLRLTCLDLAARYSATAGP
jgi:hypothetical protein